MSPAQKKAVERHRKKLASEGVLRLEVSVPKDDRDRVRELAKALREGGPRAERLRSAIQNILDFDGPYSFIEFLQSAPFEDLDLEVERQKDPPRDIGF
ncbi:hypothetical protein F3N42_08190 [Marinihelvus fidelis]|uniref:Uncharacterized protein n=1 Tax=Marinihelvus fidelis TaxID=2613842 RepID=A0A5N0TBU2_9GAMM|nr:hypothetical protein [Marinihelvus fidelis]KAA9131296.1 hypothetical protein F3N42_08190 [Marinihelvus fidelis]